MYEGIQSEVINTNRFDENTSVQNIYIKQIHVE